MLASAIRGLFAVLPTQRLSRLEYAIALAIWILLPIAAVAVWLKATCPPFGICENEQEVRSFVRANWLILVGIWTIVLLNLTANRVRRTSKIGWKLVWLSPSMVFCFFYLLGLVGWYGDFDKILVSSVGAAAAIFSQVVGNLFGPDTAEDAWA